MSAPLLSIGDFARATHLSVKTLRYYHESGLLEPAEVDPHSGYRRYEVDQIPTAQVIRRFRDLGMPIDDVRAVLRAPDPDTRNRLISRHLRRLEAELGRTRTVIASLRDLLERPATDRPVEHRHLPATRVAAISATVSTADIGAWHQGALGELYATVSSQNLDTAGLAGGEYDDSLFTSEEGSATVFLPVAASFRPVGRIELLDLAPVDLAVVEHRGPEEGIDRAYGALATYVAKHALAVTGPIREFYPVNRHHTGDPAKWRTEIGWPIFNTGPSLFATGD
ncbi:MerR family transcriptional regulator [Actinacidiphila acididurans]|uniref:MerR family transcriptional regulator n=1 Tax=Actinacidiphila acididurans TaxID=2784346 RepID=A0ABS2U6K8_9ACTN|nr:MerR family transcriptional regulator [Actinacidiphila acididurans]MBM9510140.1 MerR family transcriptional regulator [Actinacidiphila acididurans]